MLDWQVLIVDDDERVAGLHARMIDAQPGFQVAGIAGNSEQAHSLISAGKEVHLLLLDVFLPKVSGIALLRSLRARGSVHDGTEVIAITSSREPAVVQALLHLGVVDYLVKPFPLDRLAQALLRFKERRRAFERSGTLDQEQIDMLHAHPSYRGLPKNLHQETLDAVRLALSRVGREPTSAEDVAHGVAVARVTARRYLEFLVDAQEAEVTTRQAGPGRPRKLYRMVDHIR